MCNTVRLRTNKQSQHKDPTHNTMLYTANAYSAEREMSVSACTRSMAG